MTYDFFAEKKDKTDILDFIFEETTLQVFDLRSPWGQDVCEYKSTSEIVSRFGINDDGYEAELHFKLWSSELGGNVLFRKVDLNPKYCDGHTFRYATEGWGLIQLYLGGIKNNTLNKSHIGHFNEKGALKWEAEGDVRGKVNAWDWKAISRMSRKLKYQIHHKMAVRHLNSYGLLPVADALSKRGVKLWGTL